MNINNHFEISHLSAGYGNEFQISQINISLGKQCFTGIIGPNGSGKTTLFRAITGELKLTSGSVYLEGRHLTAMRYRDKAKVLAIVTQDQEIPDITVEDFVMMGRYPHQRAFRFLEGSRDKQITDNCLKMTGIDRLRHKKMQHLSGGERQLAAIARALAQEPRLLLLDEPTSHLDIRHQVEILNLLQRLNHSIGLSVLMIIHDLNMASEYCDNIILMKNGNIFTQGLPSQVMTYQNIEEAFGTVVVTKTNPLSGKPVIMMVSEKSLKENKIACD